jgi:hypothetical protein
MMLPPKPENTVFGILRDGKPHGITFTSIDQAEVAGKGLIELGHEVAIFDYMTKKVVKRL